MKIHFNEDGTFDAEGEPEEIVRRNGHNGYQITPDIALFDIRTTKVGK